MSTRPLFLCFKAYFMAKKIRKNAEKCRKMQKNAEKCRKMQKKFAQFKCYLYLCNVKQKQQQLNNG